MGQPLSDEALDAIFRQARTHNAWLPRPVDDDVLRQVYDLAKWGPTSANTMPMRIVFVKSPEAKERLKPALMPGNVEKTMAAPVCAIIANNMQFYEYIPKLFPQNPKFADLFTAPGQEEFARKHTLPQCHAARGLLHHRRARAGVGYGADVGLRQRQGGCRILPGWPLSVQLPDQCWLRRCVQAFSPQPAPRF